MTTVGIILLLVAIPVAWVAGYAKAKAHVEQLRREGYWWEI